MSRIARHLVIHGRVQGVSYRWWSVGEAEALGLDGWVRNRRDGTVEMVVAGDEAVVMQMIERCREGPPAARVEHVETSETGEDVTAGFEQKPTA